MWKEGSIKSLSHRGDRSAIIISSGNLPPFSTLNSARRSSPSRKPRPGLYTQIAKIRMKAIFVELGQEKLGTEKRRSLCSGLEGAHFSERRAEHSDGLKSWEHPRRADPQDKSHSRAAFVFHTNYSGRALLGRQRDGRGCKVRQTFQFYRFLTG